MRQGGPGPVHVSLVAKFGQDESCMDEEAVARWTVCGSGDSRHLASRPATTKW